MSGLRKRHHESMGELVKGNYHNRDTNYALERDIGSTCPTVGEMRYFMKNRR